MSNKKKTDIGALAAAAANPTKGTQDRLPEVLSALITLRAVESALGKNKEGNRLYLEAKQFAIAQFSKVFLSSNSGKGIFGSTALVGTANSADLETAQNEYNRVVRAAAVQAYNANHRGQNDPEVGAYEDLPRYPKTLEDEGMFPLDTSDGAKKADIIMLEEIVKAIEDTSLVPPLVQKYWPEAVVRLSCLWTAEYGPDNGKFRSPEWM